MSIGSTMDSATEELYFQKLQELVYDDDKIVTISSLARTLDISVQESQKLMKQFTEDQRKLKPDQLTVTYVLTGSLKHEKGRAVFLLKSSNLEEKRKCFEKVFSEVIFSIQRSMNIDFNVISLVDKLDSTTICEKPLLGSIVGINCVRGELKTKVLPPPRVPTITGKSSFFLPKAETADSTKEQSHSTDSAKTKPSGGMNSIFSKSSTSQPASKEKNKASKNGSVHKPKGGLSGFFTKSSPKPGSNDNMKKENEPNKQSDEAKKTAEDEDDKEIESVLMEIDVEDEKEKVGEVKVESKTHEENVTKQIPKEAKSKKQSKKKRQRETSEEKITKRRKRIIERNDSESDDMFEDDVEDIVERTDEETERVPSPIETKPLAPKNKMRKAVDKTYEDEEGFIVTKTEYIYLSASEDENESPMQSAKDKPKEKPTEKKNNKSSVSSENDVSPKKAAKPKKGKKNDQNQPTLMNFFKKK